MSSVFTTAPARAATSRRILAGRDVEPLDELLQVIDLVRRDAGRCRLCPAAPRRDQGTLEPELARFLEPRIGLTHAADLAAEADLAEHHHVRRDGVTRERRDQGRRDGEVGGRLGDAQPARDVEINVVGADRKAAARIEHGHHHGEPRRVPADDGAARRAGRGGGDQRLDLDQHRPRPLHAGEDRGAADVAARSAGKVPTD